MRPVLLAPLFLVAAAIPITGLADPNTTENGSRAAGRQTAAQPLVGRTVSTITYSSTVDGAPLHYHEYFPVNYNPAAPYPTVVLLPGSGGNINQYDYWPEWTNEADARGYVLMTVEPRVLSGYPGNRQTFYMNSALAPGEQDVLDGLADLESRVLIIPSRVYIAGYSMGGIGSMNLATLNPGVFAATAPGTAMSDLFQEEAYLSVPPPPSFSTLFAGAPGSSAITDTYYYQNSPRFVLTNLMHTPVWILHGISDTLIPNSSAYWPYMESRHVVDTSGYSDSRGTAATLDQLAALYPGSFTEQHSWPIADHGLASTLAFYSPTQILNFFDAHTLVTNPITIGFSTYDTRHTVAYWLQMNLVHPWSATPGLVFAARDAPRNSLSMQVTGSVTLTLDLARMGLVNTLAMTTVVQPLNGTSFAGDLAIIYSGTLQVAPQYIVKKDGVMLPASAFDVLPSRLILHRQAIDVTHTFIISPALPVSHFLPLILR